MSAHAEVLVWGDFALFSRPEFKSERVTYPVMTPSAARGFLEAIFWKPEMRWEIREISVLKPIRTMTLLRNEIEDRQSKSPFCVEDRRQPRTSLVLRDVAYLLRADIRVKPHSRHNLAAYRDQFQRRLDRGGCHHAPCLGTREFAGYFAKATGTEQPIDHSETIGTMLFDIAFCQDAKKNEMRFRTHDAEGVRTAKGYAEPLFFQANLEQGVLTVPPEMYRNLYEREDVHAS